MDAKSVVTREEERILAAFHAAIEHRTDSPEQQSQHWGGKDPSMPPSVRAACPLYTERGWTRPYFLESELISTNAWGQLVGAMLFTYPPYRLGYNK